MTANAAKKHGPMLEISHGLSLPLDTVTQTFAILARKRSGKSFTAKRITEQMFRAGLQVAVVDPKGDWWGLRSAADGKSPGLPVLILGGEHGDVPLEVNGGELVAKLVVEERVSVVLDLSLFRKHEVATFMTAFAEGLYRLKAREEFRTPVMLIIDEADAVAPQKPQHGEERMLGAIEDIVRRGGQRGIGCGVVTQRSAVLNKNVLTQAQILIAMRTIAPQDLDAMKAWVDVHGTVEQRKILMESLPSLPQGDAWFWSPGWPDDEGIFQRVHVLPIETFDSGATPKAGEKRAEPKKRAEVDVEALRRQMAETIERAAAQDPRALQKRIADLQSQVKKLETAKAPATKVEIREVPMISASDMKRLEGMVAKLLGAASKCEETAQTIAKIVAPHVPLQRTPPPAAAALLGSGRAAAQPVNRPVVAARSAARLPAGDRLPEGERIILTAIAQHTEGVTREQLTVLTGYKRSTRDAYLQRLGSRGAVGSDGDRIVALQPELLGSNFRPLPSGAALLDHWLEKLPEGERKVLEVLVAAHPHGVMREQITEATGYKRSTRDAYLQRLNARRLVVRAGTGVAASGMLFDDGQA